MDNIINDILIQNEFTWFGKEYAKQLVIKPVNSKLIPDKTSSKNWDTTNNLYFEGDNLEVLKHLQEEYTNKIKIIYIDPPYNTDKKFTYSDKQNIKEFLSNLDYTEEETKKILKQKGIRRQLKHSSWLNMIYPRLKLARNLLRDDGVIFVSIDDKEVHNLRKIMDEIYGEENFVSELIIINNLKGRSDNNFFATCNEYLLVYSKNKNNLKINGFKLRDEDIENEYKHEDEFGKYKLTGFRKTGKGWQREHRPFMYYPILEKEGKFYAITKEEHKKIYNKEEKVFNDSYIEELIKNYENKGFNVYLPLDKNKNKGRWRWGFDEYLKRKKDIALNNNNTPSVKERPFLEDGSIKEKLSKTIWYKGEYDTGSAGKYLKKLFYRNNDIFENPKSIELIKDLLKISVAKNDLILDFFSGSATTAHAVMELNAEDGGNRRFIMVQIPEIIDEKSEAYKAGYKNICEIGKERIRRAGEKIKKDFKDKEGIDNLDIGFKVFKLIETN